MLHPRPLTIAIIGSAPYNTKAQPMGEFIDSHDIIIRFNSFSVTGHEKYVGSKTTTWCFSNNLRKAYDRPSELFKEIWIVNRSSQTDMALILNKFKKHKPIQWTVPDTWIFDLSTELQHYFPSTGLIGVKSAIKKYRRFASHIYIQGMGKLHFGQQLHYYENLENIGKSHENSKELKLLKKWEKKGLIQLNMDL